MATVAYLNAAGLKAVTLAPAEYIDFVDATEAGWTDRRLLHWSAVINSRLAKRYAAPFAAPPDTPETIVTLLEQIVTWEVYLKRGIDATDAQVSRIEQRHIDALALLKEAADSKDGLLELPLRSDSATTGVSRGGPLGYSEQSPYTWSTLQRDAAADE